MKLRLIILALSIFTISSINAHEGHEHSSRMEIVGVTQKGVNLSLKMVHEGSDLKFYPLSADGNHIETSEIKITATATPRKGKPEELTLKAKEEFFSSSYTAKTLTTLNIVAIYKEKKNQLSFKVDTE